MRERSTWNRNRIASELQKLADDPRAMNQDHHSQQPAADAYDIGGPSEFAEDVTPPNWKDEQSGGETRRNEIGMPEFDSDTFKQASEESLEVIHARADLAMKVASAMLPGGKQAAIEDQALILMDLPQSNLEATYTRLAAAQQQDDADEGQDKEAAAQQQDDADEGQDKEAADQQDADEGQDKEAGKIPPQFLENVKKKKEEAAAAKDKDGDKDKDGQDKEAAAQFAEDKVAADQQDDADEGQDKEAAAQQQDADEGQDKEASADLSDVTAAILQTMKRKGMSGMDEAQMQQMAQQMAQQAMQLPQAQQQVDLAQDDADMIDQMLQDDAAETQQQQMMLAEQSIQMEAPMMDVGGIELGPEDAQLQAVFASSTEVQNAMHAANLQGLPVQASVLAPAPAAAPAPGMTRTASTHTVGTQPSGGVSQLGGAVAPAPASGGNEEINKLSGMWNTSPDVSNQFG